MTLTLSPGAYECNTQWSPVLRFAGISFHLDGLGGFVAVPDRDICALKKGLSLGKFV